MIILLPPRKVASDASAVLASVNFFSEVFTVAEYGYMQFSGKLCTYGDGKRMCFFVDRELDAGAYLLANVAGRTVATLPALCMRSTLGTERSLGQAHR